MVQALCAGFEKFVDLMKPQCTLASMSKRLCTALRTTTRCQFHYARKCASRKASDPTGDRDLLLNQPRRSSASKLQLRSFSTTRSWRAMARTVMPAGRQPAQPSMVVALERAKQQALREGQIPNDLGLMQDTFVMPFGKNRPSWLKDYKDRWRLEKKRLRMRLTEVGRYVVCRMTSSYVGLH